MRTINGYLALGMLMILVCGAVVLSLKRADPADMPEMLSRARTGAYRGLAILMVISAHFMGAFGNGITWFTPIGGAGVSVFLVLSGYGINTAWNSSQERGKEPFRHWWMKRVRTVLIPYWIVQLLLYWPFHPFDPAAFALDLTLIKPCYRFGWYLSFLFVWYAIFYVVRRIPFLDQRRMLCFAAASLIVFFTQRELLAEQAASYLIGIILSEKTALTEDVRWRHGLALLGFGVAFLALKQHPAVREAPQVLMNLVQLCIKLPIGMGMVVLVYMIGRSFRIRFLYFLGAISYELYLIHGYLLSAVPKTLAGGAAFLIGSVVCAYLFWIARKKGGTLAQRVAGTAALS